MEARANATNHAIVQSLIASVEPGRAPPPSCVPTELGPLTLLYVDEYRNVQLKIYDNMVALACGCH